MTEATTHDGRIKVPAGYFRCIPYATTMHRRRCARDHVAVTKARRAGRASRRADVRMDRVDLLARRASCVGCEVGAAHARGELHPDAPEVQRPCAVDPKASEDAARGLVVELALARSAYTGFGPYSIRENSKAFSAWGIDVARIEREERAAATREAAAKKAKKRSAKKGARNR